MSDGRPRRVFLAILLAASVVGPAAACRESVARPAAATPVVQEKPAPPELPYNHAITDTARVLAGMPPGDAARFARLLARPSWTTHRTEFDANWTGVSTQRFPAMRNWRDSEFKSLTDACDTLFYPFGGPDFLNAYLLFPACNRYLLFGLEPVGSVPSLDRLDDTRIDAALAQVRESLSDIFLRDYFITKTMMTELQTPEVDGTLPLMLAFLARLDAHVISVEMDGPWNPAAGASPPPAAAPAAGGGPAQAKPGRLPGVTVTFVAAGSTRVQTLAYIRVNMQDNPFVTRTSLISYLDSLAPFTTFVKSASYLMHDDRFSRVRTMVLEQSRSILQDDTGVPYRFFDRAKWDLTLYGKYTAPIEDFKYGFQKDLDEAFKQPSAARPLPFTFGYHWRMGSSSVMLAVRKPATR